MISRLLAYTLLGLLLFVGFQVWSKRHAALPPPSTPPAAAPPAPASAASPNTQLSVTLSDPAAQPIVRQSGTPLTIPVKVSGSPHAAALNEINALIQQGKDAEAEAKLKALPPDALNDPAVRASTSTLCDNLGGMQGKASGAGAGDADQAVWNRVLEILEDAYREIGQQLGHFPAKPILVVLHTRETFQGAAGGPAWSDGLYDPVMGRIKVPTQGALTDKAWLTRVLRHEYVHALLHDRMGGRGAIPQWLNEGLAMQLAGDPPPDIPELVRGQVTLVNLSYLEGSWMVLTPKQAIVAYLEGNSATKYFIDRFGMDKMREVLGQLATGQPFPDAFKDRLFITYEDFQHRWIDELNEKIKAGRM